MVVMMLGYGVVDVPRTLWRRSNLKNTLRRQQFRVAAIHAELTEASSKVTRLERRRDHTRGKRVESDVRLQGTSVEVTKMCMQQPPPRRLDRT